MKPGSPEAAKAPLENSGVQDGVVIVNGRAKQYAAKINSREDEVREGRECVKRGSAEDPSPVDVPFKRRLLPYVRSPKNAKRNVAILPVCCKIVSRRIAACFSSEKTSFDARNRNFPDASTESTPQTPRPHTECGRCVR